MSAISFLTRRPRRKGAGGRHTSEVSVTDELRAVPELPDTDVFFAAPHAPDPLRDTRPIPVLADAQSALKEQSAQKTDGRPDRQTLERVATALRGEHPFDVPMRTETARILGDPPRRRIRPLPQPLPKTAHVPSQVALREISALPLPGAGMARSYDVYMRRIDRLTGTLGLTVINGQRAAWTVPAEIEGVAA